jgi:hypothetical protein
MTSPERLDPLSFPGCLAYLESDVPGVLLPAWRTRRSSSTRDREAVASSATAAGAGADLAPEDRTLRARLWARRPPGGRGPTRGGKR